ncbi:dehydrogenase/reductase SDR family member 7-like [Dendronephthya gigantea]|uniref:dehydrogenase/reductase SDR family member 7-like n=1 Tax=Dendronephthya gigantea TaxID=151771 RepID=UPI00106A594B|nr:dehydrogenase/reductase SDR family member 7-like [Dendronephthya gigantea]
MFFLLVAAILTVFLVFLYKNVKVDFTLKYYELFGKKVDELRGQVVWITGASSGLGEYLAYRLASAGCKLVLSARTEHKLEQVKAKCIEISGKKEEDVEKDFLVLPLDVTKYDTMQEAVKTVLDHFCEIDILVNNCGRSQRGMVENTERKVDRELFEINVLGTISLTKAVLPHMIGRKTGRIVVVSSISGKVGTPTAATYSATKFALQGYFSALRYELHGKCIKALLVCPGPVKSAVVENAATETWGKSVKDTPYEYDTTHRMETDEFANYMAIAMVNELDESWISPQPELLAAYVSQYMPSIANWFFKRYVLRLVIRNRNTKAKKED